MPGEDAYDEELEKELRKYMRHNANGNGAQAEIELQRKVDEFESSKQARWDAVGPGGC